MACTQLSRNLQRAILAIGLIHRFAVNHFALLDNFAELQDFRTQLLSAQQYATSFWIWRKDWLNA